MGYDGNKTGEPRPIDLQCASSNIIVVLNNRALQARVSEGSWKGYLERLAGAVKERGGRDLILPVALSASATRLAAYPDRAQWIDLYEPALNTDNVAEAAGLLTVHLMIAAIQHLRRCAQKKADELGNRPPHPLKEKIFLSYARSDGKHIVDLIRAFLDKHRFRLDKFLDVYDLSHGRDWRSQFEDEIAASAFIALYTDAYGSRPFCQWELLTAKAHKRPILLASFVKAKEERTFPYAGNLPLRVFSTSDADVQRLVMEILSELLRCVIWDEMSVEACNRSGLSDAIRLPRPPELLDIHFLAQRQPPVRSQSRQGNLRSIRRKLSIQSRRAHQLKIIYPDPPIGDDELQMLQRAAPHIEYWSLSELRKREP
jgi:hypothetical protein